ncbi:MAG: hypothetical protein A2934_05205 [Candidatus Sungbacteria bacterium RIFCSPLOWO2_01_FULL_47_10]|uniref:Uncharacterized protein n=1 Tax=Candidatus Sungbacteria bacterium RIFCSPLOWO2_01_FULL_47_10 TaxID=1802276 RepID=A0A1G2L6S9_9BACT|nr:MAG: hypothetical protein A2934_05205 [Candidatus Sungbacteria bacterium RIFCSPLOWO2_01_FULL_47_10]
MSPEKRKQKNKEVLKRSEMVIAKLLEQFDARETDERTLKRIIAAKEKYQPLKNARMRRLARSLRAIDTEEDIEEFGVDRRMLYYDEDSGGFYAKDNNGKKAVTVADVQSDCAWGLRYLPDPEMPHGVFRQTAKKILVNEARRDVEELYDKELALWNLGAASKTPLSHIEENWGKRGVPEGIIAETMARELLNRTSLNNSLGFVVVRANNMEDGIFKYDFKLQTSQRKRGVSLDDNSGEKEARRKKIGIQFTIRSGEGVWKKAVLDAVKKLYGGKLPVDEIIFVQVPTKDFSKAFTRWLEAEKPSGGPEQFLSKDLKMRLLKESTQGLVQLSDEEIERLIGGREVKEEL